MSAEIQHRVPLVGIELVPGAEAEAIVEAALEGNPEVSIERNPAVVIVSAPGRLEISPELVRAHLGQSGWLGTDLQVIMASYFGFISQLDDDAIVIEWLREASP